ncbi:MAG: hypothetical protein Q9168_007529 [Polycauliona sp. 1 TL-2023]
MPFAVADIQPRQAITDIVAGLRIIDFPLNDFLWPASNNNLNADHKADSRPSLNDLNDDVLLEIIAAVEQSSTAIERKDRYYINHKNQQPLSEKVRKVNDGVESPLSLIPRSQLLGPLLALSTTSRRLRHLAAPVIYKSIDLGKGESWWGALRKLDTIAKCDAVIVYSKSFAMDLYIGPTWTEQYLKKGYEYKGPRPPSRFAPQLLATLSRLGSLKKLTLVIPEYHTEVFRTTFQASGSRFPSIHTLVLGPHMDWIIDMCPNVEIISSSGYRWLHTDVLGFGESQHCQDFIESAGRAKHLQHFEMYAWWSQEHLVLVHQHMPNIRSLAMPGGRYSDGIKTLLPTLSRFGNLRTLALADISDLGAGFEPGRCGNAYMGLNGQRWLQEVQRQGIEREKKVAKTVFAAMPNLEELWMGTHTRARVARSDLGDEISWDNTSRPKPYEGR